MIEDKTPSDYPVYKTLDDYVRYYQGLEFTTMPLMAQGTKGIFGLDSFVFSSIIETIKSIHDVLSKERVSDAYALLRKYYDAAIIHIYTNLYLDEHFSLQNLVVEKVENWRSGKGKIPEFLDMIAYIRRNAKGGPIFNLLRKNQI